MGGIRIKIDGESRGIEKSHQDILAGAKEIENEYEKIAKQSRSMGQVAKQAWESTRTPQEKYKERLKEIGDAHLLGKIDAETYRRSIDKLNSEFRTQNTVVGKAATTIKSNLQGMLLPLASVGTAVTTVTQMYDAWRERIERVAEAAKEGARDIIAFAALQEEGTTRERALLAVQAGAGVATAGQSWDLVQGMQSAAGSFERGLKISQEVFAAAKAGIPVDVGAELATQAVTQGQDPAFFLRGAFAAGQASSRDPAMVGRAAPALMNFEDKRFGFAVAGQLAGTFGQEVRSYTRNAAIALSSVSGAAETYRKLGLTETASQEQRLMALARAGLDTQDELHKAGIHELEQRQAILNLVNAVQRGDFQKIQQGIGQRIDDPGLLLETRRRIERDLPETRLQREIEEADARITAARTLGDNAQEALRVQMRERFVVEELERRAGQESMSFMGRNYVGDDNRLRPFTLFMGTSFWGDKALEAVKEGNRRAAEVFEDMERRYIMRRPPAVPSPER